MTFEQAIEHYRKGCNIRISLDFIVDGWLTFKSGDEISVLPIHINSDRWQVYGLHGWVSQPIFTPENYHPGTTESREKMGDIIDKVFKILFSDIRGVLCKMPNSPSVEYIAGELHKIWGLVYVDIPKVTLKRIEEVRKEEKAKADTPCHNCITCHHYSNNNRCLISNSPVYALSVINCAVWREYAERALTIRTQLATQTSDTSVLCPRLRVVPIGNPLVRPILTRLQIILRCL